MRPVFLLFSFSLLTLLEILLGNAGVFLPLLWFGCFYFGTREEWTAAAVSLIFGALGWAVCDRSILLGMVTALGFSCLGIALKEWRSSGFYSLLGGLLVFGAGGAGALWISAGMRGVLAQEWGLLIAQTVFLSFGGIALSGLLCGILNRLAVRIGACPEVNQRKRRAPWNG